MIKNAINSSPHFKSSDFIFSEEFIEEEVEHEDNPFQPYRYFTGMKLNIISIYENKYAFTIKYFPQKDEVEVTTRPGNVLYEESYFYSSFSAAIDEGIEHWLDDLIEELETINQQDLFTVDKSIFDIFAQIDSNDFPDGVFSKEEEAIWFDRLDILENQLKSQIEQIETNQESYNKKVSELEIEINHLKKALHHLGGKTWVKMVINRLNIFRNERMSNEVMFGRFEEFLKLESPSVKELTSGKSEE